MGGEVLAGLLNHKLSLFWFLQFHMLCCFFFSLFFCFWFKVKKNKRSLGCHCELVYLYISPYKSSELTAVLTSVYYCTCITYYSVICYTTSVWHTSTYLWIKYTYVQLFAFSSPFVFRGWERWGVVWVFVWKFFGPSKFHCLFSYVSFIVTM